MTLEESLKSLNPQQLEAVNYDAGPCLIVAGAGTGKTKTLTTKIAKLIADGYHPARILAVTFTNKAAQEMREAAEKQKKDFNQKSAARARQTRSGRK